MTDLTISERLASYGITHVQARANGRLLSYRGRGLCYAHSDQAETLLDLLDNLCAKATAGETRNAEPIQSEGAR